MDDDARDRDLLRRLRAGAPGAFEEFVIAHQHRVFSVAFRMVGARAEAEDVAQETFLRAHRHLADFRGDSRLSTWLYAIAARLSLDHLAARHRRPLVSADEERDIAESAPDGAGGPGDEAERGELRAALLRAIDELPEDRRIVVVLRDLEGLAYEEIAAALGIELGTVRSRLHRARAELRNKLEKFQTSPGGHA